MQMPFTLRLIYHSFRAIVRAGFVLMLAWIIFIPANANEVTALGAREGTQYPEGLRIMRTARVVVAVAPQRAYDLIATMIGPNMSPVLVQIGINQLAAGYVPPTSSQEPIAPEFETSRDIEGPRFIQVD
ncbi:MAG: hypothetical protein NWQ23_06770 [Yoonia sp.]|uniref:hypothetical protein n=1 Tax=Yoonia sp. TaxID=2212373 RepID=UPI00273ECF00|nr:hypothetical protein [Yoonia sp.]MDP5085106.1 hypothetical protein [Yoonia sp.]MDP5361817.1 hypothetical protein [Paracoccaceae bacterium]